MKYLSWLNYANEILVVNQWDGIDKIPCPPNSTLCYNSGQVVISSLDMKKVIEKSKHVLHSVHYYFKKGKLALGFHLTRSYNIGAPNFVVSYTTSKIVFKKVETFKLYFRAI